LSFEFQENSVKKQLTIAAGILLALSTAVATNVHEGTQAVSGATTVQSPSADLSLQTSAQVVSLWKDHANSAASTPLARPL
jgi:hypothetical protein